MGWIDTNIDKDVANYLFNITLNCLPQKIGVYQRDVRPDLVISFEDLEKQLEETPEMLVFWDMLLASQKARRVTLERKREVLRGYLRRSMLKEAQTQDLRLRAEDLKEVINADKDLVNLEKQIINETYKEDIVRSVVRAIQMKAEHLRSLAGFKREEQRQVGR